MAHSYSQLLLHIVFSTKHRKLWLTDEVQDRLYPYMAGIVGSEGGVVLALGGMPDHIHLCLRWRTDAAISDLLRNVKANSSRWIHEIWPELSEFAWQEGYGVFTVSASQLDTVVAYIGDQKKHHEKRSFESEFTLLLEQHGIEFDSRYLFA